MKSRLRKQCRNIKQTGTTAAKEIIEKTRPAMSWDGTTVICRFIFYGNNYISLVVLLFFHIIFADCYMQLYEIGRLIGTGSSGAVFRCKHIGQQNSNYVVKKIKIMDSVDKERDMIDNELKLLKKLRHPNIVSFKDSFTDKNGCMYIIMEECELGDLREKIMEAKEKGKHFTEDQILDWIAQTALAINYLHSQKILHRDLKTQNLFLKKEMRVNAKDDKVGDKQKNKNTPTFKERIRLGDFGISKVLDTTQHLAQTCIGTPYYMAPQVFKYKPYSYKSDIWSLGVIIYEMCNLRLPFQAQHYNALAMKILKGSYPSITPTYSKQLRDLTNSMLNKKTQNRPTIVDILNKPFVRTRVQKYMNEMFSRVGQGQDMDDIYLDTLREQAVMLNINIGGQQSINSLQSPEDQSIKKYPSSQDFDKKNPKSIMTRRGQQEDQGYSVKRRSTFDRDSHSMEKTHKREDTESSSKALSLAHDYDHEKDAFVDHKRTIWMDRQQKKSAFLDSKKFQTTSDYSKQSHRRFKLYEQYTMEEQNQIFRQIQPIQQQIIHQESDEDLQSTTFHQSQYEQQVGETYNKSYYKLLDQVELLKYRCQTAMGGNKYLRAYNAVSKGASKAQILQILGQPMIGYWHLIDQIMFNESILKTLPKN